MKDVQLAIPKDGEQLDTIMVTGLDEFLPLLLDWHEKQVAVVQHLRTVPEGIEVEIEGAPPFKLEGESLRAYHMGIELCLNYLGKLPFYTEYEEEDKLH